MNAPFSVPFIRWANSAHFPPGRAQPWNRRLYDHELVYVLEGRGTIILEGQAHSALPNRLFLIQPRHWHSFVAAPDAEMRLLGIHFDWTTREDTARFSTFFPVGDPEIGDLFRPAQEIAGWNLKTAPFLELAGRPRVQRMLEDVVAEYGRADAQSRAIAGALLAAALGQIEREVRLLGEIKDKATVGADAVRRVQRAREILEKPRSTPISIEEAASQVGWSADHLRRMFHAVLGTSPGDIQRAARIRHAKDLLRYGGAPIAEIAERCGFDDPSHFSRVFKKQTGATPREWMADAKMRERQ